MGKKTVYETIKTREWNMKEPYWESFLFWLSLNMFIHLVLLPNFQTYLHRLMAFIVIFILCYLLCGTYPYYSVKYITSKKCVKEGVDAE